LRDCLRKDGSFPLDSILAVRAPDVASSKTTTRIYYAAAVPEIKIAALAYFGASIFWRVDLPLERGWFHPRRAGQCFGPVADVLLDRS
jgi:hypothetical protein